MFGKIKTCQILKEITVDLKSNDKSFQLRALMNLNELGNQQGNLLKWLATLGGEGTDWKLREAIAETYEETKDILFKLLKSEDAQLQINAIKAIGNLLDRNDLDKKKNLLSLTMFLQTSDKDVCQKCIYALSQLVNPKTLPYLVDVLENQDLDIKCDAILAIGRIIKKSYDDEAKKELTKILNIFSRYLQDSNLAVQVNTVKAIKEIAEKKEVKNAQLVISLTKLLKSENKDLSMNAMQALANIGSESSFPILSDYLNKTLQTKDILLQMLAMESIKKLAPKVENIDQKITSILLDMLKKSPLTYQVSIIETLHEIVNWGEPNQQIEVEFIKCLKSKNSLVRAAAADALSGTTNLDAVLELIKCSDKKDEKDKKVRTNAINALSYTANKNVFLPQVMPVLIKALQQNREGISIFYMLSASLEKRERETLVEKYTDLMPALVKIAKGTNAQFQFWAIRVINRLTTAKTLNHPELKEILFKYLKENPYSWDTIELLGKIASNSEIVPPDIIEVLMKHLGKWYENDVFSATKRVIRDIANSEPKEKKIEQLRAIFREALEFKKTHPKRRNPLGISSEGLKEFLLMIENPKKHREEYPEEYLEEYLEGDFEESSEEGSEK